DFVEAILALARTDLARGRLARAHRRGRAAAGAAARSSLRDRAVAASLIRSEAAAGLGQVDEAIRLAEACREEARAMTAHGLEGRACQALCRAFLRKGLAGAARNAGEDARRIATTGGHPVAAGRAPVWAG